MNRRGFLGGLAGIFAAGFAPAAIGSGVLMPVRKVALPALNLVTPHFGILTAADIARESLVILEEQLNLSAVLNRDYEFYSGDQWTSEQQRLNRLNSGKTIRIAKPTRYFNKVSAH